MISSKTVIIIGGPTASGKTALAIRLAQDFNTAIISADSRQCYREMTIGVAKPSTEELQLVKHYFINSHSIQQEVNAAAFEQYALQAAETIFREQPVAVMVGGTGLYIKAFCEGLDDIPPVDPVIRQQLNEQFAANGLEWLQQQVQQQDPLYYSNGEILNPQRLIRALEVKLHTGRSIREFQQQKKASRDFNVIKIGLDLPKEELHNRINHRVDLMMEEGLENEVRNLYPFRELNALRTVGYSELFDFIDGKLSKEEAIEEIKKNTRHYAKRQLTWFRKDKAFQWFDPASADAISDLCKQSIRKM